MASYEGRALAVRRVTSNDGGKTPGIDGIVLSTPSERLEAISELRSCIEFY
jgi:RNA-directed DNA polymerase